MQRVNDSGYMAIQKVVLVFARLKLAGSVDEKDVAPAFQSPALLPAPIDEKKSHGNGLRLEEVSRQTDDTGEQVFLNHGFPDQPFLATSEQQSVGNDDGDT